MMDRGRETRNSTAQTQSRTRVLEDELAGDAWPGSRAIAMAKASTANDFSNNKTALSTANLYSLTQPADTAMATTFPAGSLYGLNNSNPFDPEFNQ